MVGHLTLIVVLAALIALCFAVLIANTTIYLHRAFTHGALKIRGVALFAANWIFYTATLVKEGWRGVHITHHQHNDEEGDPHSPRNLPGGVPELRKKNYALYNRASKAHISNQLEKGNHHKFDGWDRALVRSVWPARIIGSAQWALLMFLVLLTVPSWSMPLWYTLVVSAASGFIVWITGGFIYGAVSGLVNADGHNAEEAKPRTGWAVNKSWLAVLTFGEGMHFNHHDDQRSARLRGEHDPWWCDFGWVIIQALRAVPFYPLVTDVRVGKETLSPTN